MKRHKVWAITGVVILLLTVVALAGCVSKSEYEALQANHAELVRENNTLEAELDRTLSDLMNLQASYDTLSADYDSLNTNYSALMGDYAAVSVELGEIKEVYPPTYFKDYDELRDWLDKTLPEIDTYKTKWEQHLDLQELALLDGYIWSVGYELRVHAQSYVVAGNSVYQVTLPSGDIVWVGWR